MSIDSDKLAVRDISAQSGTETLVKMEELFAGIAQILPLLGDNKEFIIEKSNHDKYIFQPADPYNYEKLEIYTPCSTKDPNCPHFAIQVHANEVIGLPRDGTARIYFSTETIIIEQGTQKTTIQKRAINISDRHHFKVTAGFTIKAPDLALGLRSAQAATCAEDRREPLKQICITQINGTWYTMGCDGVRFNIHTLPIIKATGASDVEVTISLDRLNEVIGIVDIHGTEEIAVVSDQHRWQVEGTKGYIVGEQKQQYVNWRVITPNKSLELIPAEVNVRLSPEEQHGLEKILFLHLKFGPRQKDGEQVVKLEFADQLHIEITDSVTKSSTKYVVGRSLTPVDAKTWDEWFPTMPLVKYTGYFLLDYLYDAIRSAHCQEVDLHIMPASSIVLQPLYIIVGNQIKHVLQSRRF